MNYANKQQGYYGNVRHDLIDFFGEVNNLKVLEIGAAYGETLYYLKEQKKASEVIGVELFKDEKNLDKYKKIDKLYFGNINDIDLSIYKNYFDLIILADVIEHIDEPLLTLEKAKSLLKQNGVLLISLPNIRHYSAFVKIFIKGSFKYEDNGIFDYTHVRFYCKKDMIELANKANLNVLKSEGSISNYKGKSLVKYINKLTFGFFEEFFSVQNYFIFGK